MKWRHRYDQLLYLSPDLPHGVTVSQSGRVGRLINGVKINGDTECNADLIRSGIAPTNRSWGIIHLVGDTIPGQGFSCRVKQKNELLHNYYLGITDGFL